MINNRKVSPFTINKSNVCILRLVTVKNSTPEIKKNTPEINKQLLLNLFAVKRNITALRKKDESRKSKRRQKQAYYFEISRISTVLN